MKIVYVLLTLLIASSLNASVINIMSRDYGVGDKLNFELGSSRNDAAVSALLDSNNFGAGGVVEQSVSLSSVTEFTAASLANVDIIMMAGISSFSASEQAVVADFINNGGALIGSSNRVGNEMGFLLGTSNGSFTSGTITTTSNSNPVANGPFGQVALGTTTSYVTSGVFDDIGAGEVFADTANGAFGVTFEQGLGRVILFADDDAMASNFNSVHETYFLNAVAFAATGSGVAAVPEPVSTSLLGLGLGATLLYRRRKNS